MKRQAGRLCYGYNFFSLERTKVATPAAAAAGTHQVRMEFAYDSGVGKGGTVTVYLDGPDRRRPHLTHRPSGFSADETTNVSCDTGSPVGDDYPATDKAFTAR